MSVYLRPQSLSEAVEALAVRPDLRLLAGGTDLYPGLGDGIGRAALMDIGAIPDLGGVRQGPDGVRIGAAATWTELQRAGLGPVWAALTAAGREVGSPQIQNVATVVGNLCNASPAADGTVALLALDAEVEIAGPDGTRRLPVAAFVTGVRQIALTRGEMVTALHLPPRAGRSAFVKLGARRYLVISIAMVAARLALDPAGRVAEVAIAVGACSPVARRQPRQEAALVGLAPADLAAAVRPDLLDGLAPIDDVRAPAGYRDAAVPVLIRRALAACLTDPEEP